jgi:hypothetical protein
MTRTPITPAPRYLSFTTRCFARVYRHDGEPLDLKAHIEHGKVEGAPTIIACTTSKTLAAASGTFSLTLRLPHDYPIRDEIRNADWISIWWQRGDQTFHGMLGNIDGVRRSRGVSEGATTEDWIVNGRDVGKVFETAEVWFNEYAKFETNVGGQIFGGRLNYIPGGSPDRVVENLISAFIGGDGNVGGAWRWPQGLRGRFGTFVADGLKLRILGTKERRATTITIGDSFVLAGGAGLLRGEMIDQVSLFQPEVGTKLHDMVTQWSNPVLNELYYDLYTEDDAESPPDRPKPMVFLRERPFVNSIQGIDSPWFKIPTVRVDRSECGPDDLGSSDQERVNMIMLYARSSQNTQAEQFAAYPPAIDQLDAQVAGLRRWERTIDFAGIGSTGTGVSWGEEIKTWETLLQSWYGLNHEWLNGSVNFNFILAEARIGYRLIMQGKADEDTTQAYIEGVSTSWRYPSGGTTSLSLTRGFIGSDAELVRAVKAKQERFARPVLVGTGDFVGPSAGPGAPEVTV